MDSIRIRTARLDELRLLQGVEAAAGRCFREIGMPEIADDSPLPLAELAHYQQAGLAWVAVDARTGQGPGPETDTGPGAGVSAGPEAGAGRDKETPVAYLIADPVDGNLHVEQVSVHPDRAHRRIGRALLDHLADHASARAIPALTLTTFTQVPWNAPYYARCGFRALDDAELTAGLRRIRAREAAYGLDRWPRVCMRKDL